MRDSKGPLQNTPERGNYQRVPHARPYYEDLGVGHDALMRCDDCKRLVLYADMMARQGLTPCCGTRKVKEIRALSVWEWIKVRLGILDFPYRDKFLAEFSAGGRS